MPTLNEVYEEMIRVQGLEQIIQEAQSERVGPSLLSIAHIAPNRWFHMLPSGEYVEGQTQPRASVEAARPLSLADLEWVRTTTYRPIRQLESAAQPQGGQMRISTIPDPLTIAEQARLRTFFREVLINGYSVWPISGSKVIIHIDGMARRVYSDSCWALTEECLYIGRLGDRGNGVLENPGHRLACIVALMGVCEMQNDPELVGLVEKRLAKILAGVYENAIAPLAQRTNKEPIAKIAWSHAGGVAAWVDGKWASPITGEEVTLKTEEGWVVVETGEGKAAANRDREEEFRRIAQSESRVLLRQDFDQWVNNHDFFITQTEDGRPAVCYEDAEFNHIQEVYLPPAIREGGPNLEIVQNTEGLWGIAPVWAPTPTLEEANRQLRIAIDAAGNVGMGPILPDGRQTWVCSDYVDAEEYLRLYQETSAIPYATIENIDSYWYVVSMPASQLPAPF